VVEGVVDPACRGVGAACPGVGEEGPSLDRDDPCLVVVVAFLEAAAYLKYRDTWVGNGINRAKTFLHSNSISFNILLCYLLSSLTLHKGWQRYRGKHMTDGHSLRMSVFSSSNCINQYGLQNNFIFKLSALSILSTVRSYREPIFSSLLLHCKTMSKNLFERSLSYDGCWPFNKYLNIRRLPQLGHKYILTNHLLFSKQWKHLSQVKSKISSLSV